MPTMVEIDGKQVEVYTREELDKEVQGLKVTLSNIKAEKKEAEAKIVEAKDAARLAEEEKAKASGDLEKVNQLQEQRQRESEERYNVLINQVKTEKINNQINDLVTKHGAGGEKNEDLRDLLSARYNFSYDNDSGSVSVSGANVNSLDDLVKEINASGRYDAYLAGSKANGGGSTVNSSTGAASGKKFNEYSGAELVEIRKENPAEYDRLKSEYDNQ